MATEETTKNEVPVDVNHVTPLALKLFTAVREHYNARGDRPGRDVVHEVLNALAWPTAHVIYACGSDGSDGDIEAETFFQRALHEQIDELGSQEEQVEQRLLKEAADDMRTMPEVGGDVAPSA